MSVSDDTAVDSEALPGGAGKSGGGTLQVKTGGDWCASGMPAAARVRTDTPWLTWC
jgi:hypothetical protein